MYKYDFNWLKHILNAKSQIKQWLMLSYLAEVGITNCMHI